MAVPVLICGDAGSAGRVFLGRPDMDLWWATDRDEIEACLGRGEDFVVVANERFAEVAKAAMKSAGQDARSLVVLEALGFDGAHGSDVLVVDAEDRDAVVRAVSAVSGLPFRACARVPYADLVECEWNGQWVPLSAVDISRSGISLRSPPVLDVGATLRLRLAFAGQSFALDATIVRRFERDEEPAAGLVFQSVSEPDGKSLTALVDHLERNLSYWPDPRGLTLDLAGGFTMDLSSRVDRLRNPNDTWRKMLSWKVSGLSETRMPRMPRWLGRVAASLTDAEVEALQSGADEGWAIDATELRIALHRLCAEPDRSDESVSRAAVMEFCRTLGQAAADAPPQCADRARARADLMRYVYSADAAVWSRGAETEAA